MTFALLPPASIGSAISASKAHAMCSRSARLELSSNIRIASSLLAWPVIPLDPTITPLVVVLQTDDVVHLRRRNLLQYHIRNCNHAMPSHRLHGEVLTGRHTSL